MALPTGLNRSRSALAFLVNENVPGTIETHSGTLTQTQRNQQPPDLPNASTDAFGLVSVPVIGQQGNYSDTSEIGPELITTDRVLNYMEYSTFDLEYYAKPGGLTESNTVSSGTSAIASGTKNVTVTKASSFGSYAIGDTIRVSGTGDAANCDGLFTVSAQSANSVTYVCKKTDASAAASNAVTVVKLVMALPKEDKILARCFGGRKFMSTGSSGYTSGKEGTTGTTSSNATCVSYFLKNTIETLTVHSRQFTDDSIQMYTAAGSLPTSFSVTFAKDGAVTYTSGFQSNRVYYTGTAELQNTLSAVTSGTNFDVVVTGPKRHGKDSTATASDIAYAIGAESASNFVAGSQVKIRVKAGSAISGVSPSPTVADQDFGPYEVKEIVGNVVTLGGATSIGAVSGSGAQILMIPFLPDAPLETSVIDQRQIKVFMADAIKDSGNDLLDYNPAIQDVSDANVMLAGTSATTSHLFNDVNGLEVTSVNFDFDRAITTPGLTEMSGESFPPASYIINEPTISGSITLLLRPKDFQLMNSLRDEPRRSVGVRVGTTPGKIIEMGAASAFFEVPSPADADGATQIDIPFTIVRGDLGETEDANKFFVRYR